MSQKDQNSKLSGIVQWFPTVLGLPWFEIVGDLWKLGKKVIRGLSNEGIYEVLEYETTLELHDSKGKKATLKKREKVRYIQDNMIAYQDQAWGNGDILQAVAMTMAIRAGIIHAPHETIERLSKQLLQTALDAVAASTRHAPQVGHA